ncbi:MAG: lysophospholipase [Caulobacteraceae bacterium]|nr:lysophospholipase [Caulobacteraceae bacterium]
MIRRVVLVLAALVLAACAPMVQQAGRLDLGFEGPRLEAHDVVSFDGARLGLTSWTPEGREPWAVIVGVHGMNDYSNAFHLAAPYWAGQGVATYAYDQRGFGRSPGRGIWAGEMLMTEDLRIVTALVRQRYPHALIAVVGESMGAAVAIEAFASDRPPAADRLVLVSPAVWGWSSQPLPNKAALWVVAHLDGGMVVNPPRFVTRRIMASDNLAELVRMGRDPLQLWGARSDTLYGLVDLMQRAWRDTGKLPVATLDLHGDHDQIIPRRPALQAASRLKPTDRSADYARGWHLLLVDTQAEVVWRDIASFIADPAAPLPSGAPVIPGAPTPTNAAAGQAAVGGATRLQPSR